MLARTTIFALVASWALTSAALAAQPLKGPLVLGAVGFAGKDIGRSVRTVAGYLSGGAGLRVEVSLFSRYDDVLDALEKKKLDLAFLTPVLFLLARDRLGVQPLATPVYPSGEGNYRAVLLASVKRKDIAQLLDLKGKKVAFVDKHSASGYVVPRAILDREGLKGPDDVREVFTGNHVKSLEALVRGDVDAAATYDMLLAQTPSLGKTMDDFTVLARSDPIPGDVLAASKAMPEAGMVKLQTLLLEFGKKRETDKKLADCLYQRFFAYDASRYDELGRMLKAGTRN